MNENPYSTPRDTSDSKPPKRIRATFAHTGKVVAIPDIGACFRCGQHKAESHQFDWHWVPLWCRFFFIPGLFQILKEEHGVKLSAKVNVCEKKHCRRIMRGDYAAWAIGAAFLILFCLVPAWGVADKFELVPIDGIYVVIGFFVLWGICLSIIVLAELFKTRPVAVNNGFVSVFGVSGAYAPYTTCGGTNGENLDASSHSKPNRLSFPNFASALVAFVATTGVVFVFVANNWMFFGLHFVIPISAVLSFGIARGVIELLIYVFTAKKSG